MAIRMRASASSLRRSSFFKPGTERERKGRKSEKQTVRARRHVMRDTLDFDIRANSDSTAKPERQSNENLHGENYDTIRRK